MYLVTLRKQMQKIVSTIKIALTTIKRAIRSGSLFLYPHRRKKAILKAYLLTD